MKYEISEEDWEALRLLLADLRLMLSGFYPKPYPNNHVLELTALDKHVYLMDSRAERLMSAAQKVYDPDELAEMAVTAAIEGTLTEVVRQGGPEYLAKEAEGAGILAAKPFLAAIGPRSIPEAWRAAPPLPLPPLSGNNLARALTAERAYQAFVSPPAPTSDESSHIDEINEVRANTGEFERYEDPNTGEYRLKRKK